VVVGVLELLLLLQEEKNATVARQTVKVMMDFFMVVELECPRYFTAWPNSKPFNLLRNSTTRWLLTFRRREVCGFLQKQR